MSLLHDLEDALDDYLDFQETLQLFNPERIASISLESAAVLFLNLPMDIAMHFLRIYLQFGKQEEYLDY